MTEPFPIIALPADAKDLRDAAGEVRLHVAQLQIDSAARGMVSGTLAEWPLLRATFDAFDYVTYPGMTAPAMQRIARKIAAEQGWA